MTKEDLLGQLNSEEEALALMSSMGFLVKDWPFIQKIGGATKLLNSDLLAVQLGEWASARDNLRAQFDRFYQTDGFLISPVSFPHSRLFKYKGAPLVFYGRHNKKLLNQRPMVAIVGSRMASSEAIGNTTKLSTLLTRHGIAIVSGGAIGIDEAAHRAALANDGATLAILGSRCNLTQAPKFYPDFGREHLVLIHPFGPFTPQGKFMFVERNRYVAAMADALVIVQGKTGSGTLHTANFAKALKTPTFAIPGSLNDPLAFVPNYLIQNGKAKALVDFDQLLSELSNNTDKALIFKPKPTKKMGDLPELLQIIARHKNSLGFDDLLLLSKKSYNELQRELLDYELSGQIVRQGPLFVLTAN